MKDHKEARSEYTSKSSSGNTEAGPRRSHLAARLRSEHAQPHPYRRHVKMRSVVTADAIIGYLQGKQ